jgi:hypothetical protein
VPLFLPPPGRGDLQGPPLDLLAIATAADLTSLNVQRGSIRA